MKKYAAHFGKQARRLSAIALCLVLFAAVLPFSALAAATDYQITLNGVKVTSDNCADIFAGTENAGKASYDDATKTLTLNNLEIEKAASRNGCILNIGQDGVTLKLLGKNSFVEIAKKVNYTLNTVKTSGDLTIDGTGELYIENGTSKRDLYGIKCYGSFFQKGGKLTVKTGDSTTTKGLYNNQAIYVSNAITVTGGSLYAQSGKAVQLSAPLMTTSHDIRIENAAVTLVAGEGIDSYALYTNGNIYFDKATVQATSSKAQNNSRAILAGAGKKITATDCKIDAVSDAGAYSLPIWCSELAITDTDITANGGTATDESYGISAATYTQNGGTVKVKGGDAANWSIGLWSNNAQVLGGTLIATVGAANGTNAITSSPTFGTFKTTVSAGQDEESTVKIAAPDDNTYWGSRYVKIAPYVHAHNWSDTFSFDDNGHWHNCLEEDCDITESTQKDGYAVHTFDQRVMSEETLVEKATYTHGSIYHLSCLCGKVGTETFEASDMLPDETLPDGDILVHEVSVKKAENEVNFRLYYNEEITVTLTATDAQSGVAKTEYYIASAALSDEQLAAIQDWTLYTAPFTVKPSSRFVVYAKITDNCQNSRILCSDGITLDNTAPVIAGVQEGGVYCIEKAFTVSDDSTLDYVVVNGTVVEPTNGQYSTAGQSGTLHIVAADLAGNVASVSITVNAAHTYDHDADADCNICGLERMVALPEITAGQNEKWEQNSEKSLTFTSNAPFAAFRSVSVDGKTVDEKYYEKREGSTIITLKPEFLSTLAAGTHTLTIHSQNGAAATEFTIAAAAATTPDNIIQPAQTNDTVNMQPCLLLLAISCLTAVGAFLFRKKKSV